MNEDMIQKKYTGFIRKIKINTTVLIALMFFVANPCSAATMIGGLTELQAALAATGANTFTATTNISVVPNLGALTGDSLSVFGGTSYNLDGGGLYSGITATAGKTIDISNYGSLNGLGDVSTAIQGFNSDTSGAFLAVNDSLSISSSVLYNNISSGSTTAASLDVYGPIYQVVNVSTSYPTALVLDNNSFFANRVSSANTAVASVGTGNINAYGGAVANVFEDSGVGETLTASITGNTFGSSLPSYGNSASATNSTITTTSATNATSYGGAIYNSVTASGENSSVILNINDSNSFISNNSTAIVNNPSQTTGMSTATAYGGAIYNSLIASGSGASVVASMDNSNSFIGNTTTALNEGSSAIGIGYAYGYGGAVANLVLLSGADSTATISIDSATFKSNVLSVTSNSKPTSTTIATSTLISGVTAAGGAIYTTSSISSNVTASSLYRAITSSIFGGDPGEGNTVVAINSSLAPSGAINIYAKGGAIYNDFVAATTSNCPSNVFDINYNVFRSNSSSATNQDNSEVIVGTTTSSGVKAASAHGGAIFNSVSVAGVAVVSDTTTNIKGNTFGTTSADSNKALAFNNTTTTTTSATSAYAYGGAIYNFIYHSSLNSNKLNIGRTELTDTTTADNTFYFNKAVATNNGITKSTTPIAAGSPSATACGGAIYNTSNVGVQASNSLNLKYNTYVSNSAEALNNAVSDNLSTGLSGTTTATASGGAIYNYATMSGLTSHIDFAVENSIFGGSNSADGNAAVSINKSWSRLATKASYAYGGAIYNEIATSTSQATNNSININYNVFKNNIASSSVENNTIIAGTSGTKTTLSIAGGIYNKLTLSGANASFENNIKGNIFGTNATDGNKALASNTDTTITSGSGTSSTTYAGALYNWLSLGSRGTVVTNLGRTASDDTSTSDNTFYYNKAVATNSSITNTGTAQATSYGGAIYNYFTALGTSSNTLNSYYNTFVGNSAEAINTSTVSSATTNTPGAAGSTSYGGAIYNESSLTGNGSNIINLINNTFTDNTALGSNTVNSNSTGYTYAYAYGGAIYNTMRSTSAVVGSPANTALNIEYGVFKGNVASAVNNDVLAVAGRTYAYAYGGAIYNTSTVSGIGINNNSLNITHSVFGGDLAAEGNKASAENSSTMTTNPANNTYTYAYGGAIYNTMSTSALTTGVNSNALTIEDTIFKNNAAIGLNTSNSTSKPTYVYGGAIYNSMSASGSGTATNLLSLVDSSFEENSAISGGAVFNFVVQSGSGNNTNTLNIIGTTDTSNKFIGNSANAGGAIYNYYANLAATTTDNSYFDFNIEKTTFDSNAANTGSGGAIINSFTITGNGKYNTTMDITSGSIFSSNYGNGASTAKGGAIYNNFSASSSTSNATNYDGSVKSIQNIEDSRFENNYVTSLYNTNAVSYGGAIYNSMLSTSLSSSTGVSNVSSTLSLTVGNNTVIAGNYAIAESTSASASQYAEANGGAIYNYLTSAGNATSTTSSTAPTAHTAFTTMIDSGTIQDNYVSAKSTTLARAYGGAIFNSMSTTTTATNVSTPTSTSTSTSTIQNGSTFSRNYAKAESTGITMAVNAHGGAIYNYFSITGRASNTGVASVIATFDSTINDSTFDANYTSATAVSAANSYGGAIYNLSRADATETQLNKITGSNDITTTIGNTIFSNNYAYANSTGNTTNSSAKAFGGAIYNNALALVKGTANSTLTINNNSSFSDNYASATSANRNATAYGGAIYNDKDSTTTGTVSANLTVDNTTFERNYVTATAQGDNVVRSASAKGGAIYNTMVATISNSSFDENNVLATGTTASAYISGYGGAIYNSGTMTIKNSSFTDNTASTLGGAVYNSGTLYIVDDNKTTTFTGNNVAGASSALYLDGGIACLNADAAGEITFNDKIDSSAIGNVINVNKTDIGLVSGGNVVFNNTVSDSTINLYSGSLTLGEAGSVLTNTYLSNVNLNLENGVLDLENGLATDVININNFTMNPLASLKFDANLLTGLNDRINVAGTATGTLNISSLNVVVDAPATTMTLVTGPDISALTLSDLIVYTNFYRYDFVGSNNGTYSISRDWADGLNSAVACDNTTPRSFSAVADATISGNLGAMGLAGSTLNVFGNGHGIFGFGYEGIEVGAGQTLNIYNSPLIAFFAGVNGSIINNSGTATIENSTLFNNFAVNGGAIYNTGTLNIKNSTFMDNIASEFGGAIYNSGTLNIFDDTQTTNFSGNTAGGNLNAIYLAGGTANINAAITGRIIFRDKISSSSIENAVNVNKTDIGLASGGNVVFNNTLSDLSLSLYNGTMTLGSAGFTLTNEYLSNVNLNLQDGTLDLCDGLATGVLNLNNFVANPSASLKIDANLATGQVDKINVSGVASGTLNLGYINILEEAETSSFTLVSGSNISGLTLNDYDSQVFTNFYKYSFTGSNNGTYSVSRSWSDGLNSAVECDILAERSFSATSDANVIANLGPMGLAGSTLSINGNNHTINGQGFSGIGVNAGQALNISGVDSWNGFSSVNGGVVNNAGTTNITNSVFGDNVATVSGGALYNTGTATLTNTSFVNNTAVANGGAIYNSGDMSIIADNANVSFTGNRANGNSNAIYLDTGSTLNINAGNGGSVTFNDRITSNSIFNSININKPGIIESDGSTVAPRNGTVYVNNTISDSTINLFGGTLALGRENYLNGNNLNLNGGMLNMINGSIGTLSLNTLSLAPGTTTNLGIDANLASGISDRITANTYNTAGTLNISNVNFLNDKNGGGSFSVVESGLASAVTSTATSAWGPVFKYNLDYNSSTGMMSASSVSGGNYTDYNPAVLTNSISSLTGTYLSQVNTYSEALGRAELFMSMPQNDRLLMKYQNKYAYAGNDTMVFSPTFLPETSAGLWCKQYSSFENVPLSNGPRVSTIGYGALIGGDTALVSLKNGYEGYLTTYVGYNGSNQNYGNVGVNQNGGTLGVTGTVYKGNFFAALTANVGASSGVANTIYGNDYFNTLIAGVAAKTGYNIEFMGGKLIFQPSFSMAYTFANTFDYKTAAGVDMTSNPLHAVQISPGIKVIGNLENGWQPYLGVNMVWNIMDNQRVYANDVQLPQMSVDPYLEYGVGLQRKWGDRFTGFGQAMLRGGGRNGIALQFGFRVALGK